MTTASDPTIEGGTSGELDRRLGSALLWVYLGTYAGKMLVFGSVLILARALSPRDFALVAFALAVVAFLDLSDFGVGSALVWLDRDEAERSQSVVFTLQMLGSIVAVGLMNLFAPAIASLSDDPRAETVLRVLSLNVIIQGLGYTHENILRRNLDFRRRFVPDFFGGLAKGGIGVTLALAGAGVWALVAAQLAGTFMRSCLLWVFVSFRPHFDLGLGGRARRLLSFGSHIVVIGLLSEVILNVDYIIVGKVLGLTALGFYVIAFRVPELIIRSVLVTASQVLFPYYARAREFGDDPDGRYLGSLRVASLVAAPVCVVLTVLSGPVILTLFGEKWEPSVELMPGLALYATFDVLGGMAGDIYKAHGKPWILTVMGSVRAAILIPGLIIAANIGLVWVAWFQAALAGAVALVSFFVVGRLTEAHAAAHVRALAPAVLGALVSGVIAVGIERALEPAVALLVGVPVVFATFIAYILATVPETRVALRRAARAGNRRRLALPASMGGSRE